MIDNNNLHVWHVMHEKHSPLVMAGWLCVGVRHLMMMMCMHMCCDSVLNFQAGALNLLFLYSIKKLLCVEVAWTFSWKWMVGNLCSQRNVVINMLIVLKTVECRQSLWETACRNFTYHITLNNVCTLRTGLWILF